MTPDELASEEKVHIAEQVRRESFNQTIIRPKDPRKRVIKTHKGEVEIFLPEETIIQKAANGDVKPKSSVPVVESAASLKSQRDAELASRVEKKSIESLDDILARMTRPTEEPVDSSITYPTTNPPSNKRPADPVPTIEKKKAKVEPTPPRSEEIWTGKLHMPSVGSFNGTARQTAGVPIVGGRKSWSNILPAGIYLLF
jgi:hypothetical protein